MGEIWFWCCEEGVCDIGYEGVEFCGWGWRGGWTLEGGVLVCERRRKIGCVVEVCRG